MSASFEESVVPDDEGSKSFAIERVQGTWSSSAVVGPATLILGDLALELEADEVRVRVHYHDLTGAGWHTGELRLHASAGAVTLTGAEMNRAWLELVSRALAVPEFTRSWRALHSRDASGVPNEDQAAFFTPFIHARRRLEDEPDVERRMTAFQAPALRGRVVETLESFGESFKTPSAADRRALRAELFDTAAVLLSRFELVEREQLRFEHAAEAVRLDAWRAWIASVAALYAEADRCWRGLASMLPRHERRRRRKRPGRDRSSLGIAFVAAAV